MDRYYFWPVYKNYKYYIKGKINLQFSRRETYKEVLKKSLFKIAFTLKTSEFGERTVVLLFKIHFIICA